MTNERDKAMRTFAHATWKDRNGNPCTCREVQTYTRAPDGSRVPYTPPAGQVIVRWNTLPHRCVLPAVAAMHEGALIRVGANES